MCIHQRALAVEGGHGQASSAIRASTAAPPPVARQVRTLLSCHRATRAASARGTDSGAALTSARATRPSRAGFVGSARAPATSEANGRAGSRLGPRSIRALSHRTGRNGACNHVPALFKSRCLRGAISPPQVSWPRLLPPRACACSALGSWLVRYLACLCLVLQVPTAHRRVCVWAAFILGPRALGPCPPGLRGRRRPRDLSSPACALRPASGTALLAHLARLRWQSPCLPL